MMIKKILFLFLFVIICFGFYSIYLSKTEIIELEPYNPVEMIPLYYNLDNPNIIYTVDENYNFKEVVINE